MNSAKQKLITDRRDPNYDHFMGLSSNNAYVKNMLMISLASKFPKDNT